MKLRLLAFGIAKDILGGSEKELEIQENARVYDLKILLETEFSKLKQLNAYFIAVDNEYADDDQLLYNSKEIAIIPPVSGG